MRSAVKLAAANIDGCDSVGISIVYAKKRIQTPAATDQLVMDADRLQYETGEGPCLDAIWEQRTIHSPSLGYDRRWPAWGPRVVRETEAQSVLAFQLFTHGDSLGALNVYSRTRGAFDEQSREDGQAIAAHIAIAVAAAQQVADLEKALDSRTVIGEATGILMERFDMDPEGAFKVLARLSSHSNTKIRDLAAEVVATRRLPEPPPQ